MSWRSGSLDPPRQSLPKLVGALRRSRNNPSLNGSILDDNSVVDSNKRESQWWKRLNSEDKNSTADFFPISNINIDPMEGQINIQPEESTEYQSNNEEDEVSFSTISSLNLSLSTRPLFKKGGQKNSSLEMNQTLGNFKYKKTLFKNMVSGNKSVNYNLANLSPNSPDGRDFHDENDDDELLKEPIKKIFSQPDPWIKNGKSVFAGESSNHSASKLVNYDSEDSVTNVAKKSLFEKAPEENVETMSIFAEGLITETDSPLSQSIEYASGNSLKSILSGGEKKKKLFKMTVEMDRRTELKKSVFVEAQTNDHESDILDLHSVNEQSEKSIEIKKSLFKNSSRKNVDYKSVFARALASNSEIDTILDLPEPDLKKQKFSQNEVTVSNTNINNDPHLDVNADDELDISDLHNVNEKLEKSIEIKKSLFKNANRKNVDYKSVFAQALTSNSEPDIILDLPEPDLKKQKFSENAVIVSNTNIDTDSHLDIYADYESDILGLHSVNEKSEKSIEIKKSLFKNASKKNVDYKSMFAQALTSNSESDTVLDLPVANLEKQKNSKNAVIVSNTNINVVPHLDVNAENESDKSGLHSVNEKSEKSIEIKKSLFKNASRKNVDYKSMFAQALTSNSESDTVLDLLVPDLRKQFSENAVIVSNTNINTVPNLDVYAAEQMENIYSSKTHRKSSLMKSRRQSDNDGLSMKSGNSPMSIASDTMNFDMWKQVASSTMMESPQTPRRDNARTSRNLLPVRSLMHPDISEEKEGSTVSLHTKNDSKVLRPIRDQPVGGKNGTQFAIVDDLIPKETTKNISNTSMTQKENINDENNTSVTRRSKRISKKNDSSSKSSIIKDLDINEMDENQQCPVKNAKQSHEPSHLIEKGIPDVGSPNTENFPQPHTFEISKRQSVGTWLKLQDSEPDTVPNLNQSYIDKQVMEEIMAKRTNPPVRRSTYENVNKNNSTPDNTLACDRDGSSPINNSAESERKKYTVRHSNVHNLITPTDDPQMKATVATTLESPIAAKDVSNKINSKNRSSTRNDEDHVSSSSLIKIVIDSKEESSREAISTEVVHLESELQQNNKSLSDDQISDDENIFTPRKLPKTLNVQNAENSIIHNSDKNTADLTDLNVSADTSYAKNTERSISIQDADTSHSKNNSAFADTTNDSGSNDDISEALFDVKEDLVEPNQKNLHETLSPIVLKVSMEKIEVNQSQNSKRLTETVPTSKITINNKENAPPVSVSQTDILKHLEKLELGNLQRNKKAEEFSKQYLARKIVYLKSSTEKNKLSFKLNKNHAKRTTSKVILDKRETGINSKKKKNKSKSYLKEHWVTSYLRSFVEKKLKPRYGFETNVRAEKFIKDLVQIVKSVEDAKSAYHQYVDTLKIEMARLAIVKTHFEFYRFIQVYLPYYFRIRSIPSCDRSVPNLKEGLFTDIVIDDKE